MAAAMERIPLLAQGQRSRINSASDFANEMLPLLFTYRAFQAFPANGNEKGSSTLQPWAPNRPAPAGNTVSHGSRSAASVVSTFQDPSSRGVKRTVLPSRSNRFFG